MKLNRKRVVTGLVATGLAAGALAGGGVALASAGAAPAPRRRCGPSYGPGSGHFDGMDSMGGLWSGQQPVMNAAADYLGLNLNQLYTLLQSGTSLADIAEAQGKTVPGLKNALLSAMTSRINANTALTAQQKAAMISQAKDHLDTMINMDMPHSPGMGTGMGTGMGSHMTGTDSPMGGMWR